MTTITRELQIDAGHRVPLHGSKCRSPHGHRYRFIVEVEGVVPDSGMIIDFGILKEWMVEAIDEPWDHAMILQSGEDDSLINYLKWSGFKVAEVPFAPTAENLAEEVFNRIARYCGAHDGDGYRIICRAVTCYETPNCSATYRVH